jgi:hypothetical protein
VDVLQLPNPWDRPGEWLKVQLHSHTTASDGELSPEYAAEQYAAAGFDVLVITDHWTVTPPPKRDDLLLIPGAELAVDPVSGPMIPEFLAIGIDELPEDPGGDRDRWYPYGPVMYKTFPDFGAGASFVREQGGVGFLCHPSWSGLPEAAVLAASAFRGMEVWNASGDRENDRGDSSYVWDRSLDEGIPFTGIGTDDSHYPGSDVDDGWTMVRAEERSREAIVRALGDGLSYASGGPAMDVQRDGEAVEISCSPCSAVVLHGRYEQGWGVTADRRARQLGAKILERDHHDRITRARIVPDDEEPPDWMRVVVTDATGRKAWSNPI